MAKQVIQLGTSANDGTGDPLRSAFTKVNANFTELYTSIGTIPTDISQLTDTTHLLGQGGTGSSLVNGEYTVELNSSGNLTVPQRLIIGGTNSNYESHLEIDASNYWTSIQWTHLPFAQDPNAGPFECQAQLMRVFSGSGEIEGHEELVAVSVVKPTNTTYNGLMLTTSDGKIPDAPYNDGVGTMYNWVFGGDGTTKFPNNTLDAGSSSIDIKSSDYAELWYHGVEAHWHADPTRNSEAYIWTAWDGSYIQNYRGDDGTNPQWNYQWGYHNDGTLSFPTLNGNTRTGSGNNLQFQQSYNQKIISTKSGTESQQTVERLVISGGDSYFDGSAHHGEGGDIYLWAGAGENGGDIKVDGGNSSTGEGGTIKIRGGNSSSGTGGFVEIWSGSGATGAPIKLSTWNSGWNQWIFETNGKLTLPVNGDIVNSDGHSVIKSIPQNLRDDNQNYTLSLSDAGKHIYMNHSNNYVWLTIPTNADVAFDIGTAITIVTNQNVPIYINSSDSNTTKLYVPGLSYAGGGYDIPPNSMATLLKVEADVWMLSGYGITID